MYPIIKAIFKNIDFSEEEASFLFSSMHQITLNKGQFLLSPNQIVDDIFYVHSGCLRSYFIDKNGKEHILQFAIKDWWISDYITLFGASRNSTAVSYIECIKNAIVYRISKKEFDEIRHQLPKVGHFYIKKMELAFASFQNRILENLTLTAKERYLNFIATYPDIESNVKNYHIASFLGITTESLSRIRREIASS